MKEAISKDIIKAIKEALKLEVNGKEFFKRAEELTKNELGKKMFRRLANDEIRHFSTFSELFTEVLGGEDWKGYIEEKDLKEDAQVIEELVQRMKREESASEIEGIRIGMELEKKAIEFFEKSAKQVNAPKAKEKYLREYVMKRNFIMIYFKLSLIPLQIVDSGLIVQNLEWMESIKN